MPAQIAEPVAVRVGERQRIDLVEHARLPPRLRSTGHGRQSSRCEPIDSPAVPPTSSRPAAVLLDVGGIFHLPGHEHVVAAFERGGFAADAARPRPRALLRHDVVPHGLHGRACRGRDVGRVPRHATSTSWASPDDARARRHEHLQQEFTAGGLWSRIIPGSVDDLGSWPRPECASASSRTPKERSRSSFATGKCSRSGRGSACRSTA